MTSCELPAGNKPNGTTGARLCGAFCIAWLIGGMLVVIGLAAKFLG